MKLLFKQAIKSVFSNKIFTSIMLIIIFISGATYTLFQSTANSFKRSYNQLMEKGNIHDDIIKQKYEVKGSYSLEGTTTSIKTDAQYTADIKYLVPIGSTSDNNDYLSYFLSKQYKNNIITSVITPKPAPGQPAFTDAEKEAQLETLVKDAISNQTSAINKNVVSGKSIDFAKAITEIYKKELATDNTQSLVISNASTAFKAVTSDTIDPANDYLDGFKKSDAEWQSEKPYANPNVHNVNKLVMYDGTNEFTQNQTYGQMFDELKWRASVNIGLNINADSDINRSKGYRWSVKNSIGQTTSVTDPSSYQTVVSPSYANQNNKTSVTPNDFLNLYKKEEGEFPNDIYSPDTFMEVLSGDTKGSSKLESESKKLQKEYANNIIWVDRTPYFIIGIGTTPDFAYPIVDAAHPTPDINTQAVVFMNRRGYERIYDAFRTAPNENYISLKFNSGISTTRRNAIASEIEYLARNGKVAFENKFPNAPPYAGNIPVMSWPKNVKIVTHYSQPGDSILLAEERVTFIAKLEQTLSTLSYITTIMLLIFVSSIVILVFSSMLETKRKVIATLLSLGYKKSKIALSFASVSLAIGAVPSIFGYIAGHFFQYGFINIFNDYWTIPVYGEVFSWISLLIVVVLPFVALFVLIYLICMWQMRHNITQMLHDNVEKYNFAPSILKYFKWFGVKFKYSISLIINNFGRLILISITGIISVAAIIVGLSTLGQAKYAYNATSSISNYTFKVDLYSPTKEGGTYNDVNYDTLHDKLYGPSGNPIGATYNGTDPTKWDKSLLNQPNWHIPGEGDAILANNPTSTPITLPFIKDYLRYKLQAKPLLDFSIAGSSSLNPWKIATQLMPDNQKNIANENALEFMKPVAGPGGSLYPSIPNSNQGGTINPDYVKYFAQQLNVNEPNELYPYTLSYQNVITNPEDETYTYISTEFEKDKKMSNYHITGYKPDTKYLNIPSNMTKKLEEHANDNNKPILINKYVATNLGYGVGDTITMNVLNNTDRFDVKGSNMLKHEQKFNIVGILNTYDDNSIFTLQSIANNVIGMNNIPNPTGKNNDFNGVFTKKKSPALLNSLPLYSPSGIYLATDIITTGGWSKILQDIIDDSSLWNQSSTHIVNVPDFISKYGNTPLVGSFDTINWKSINEYTFKNISTLSSYLIAIIQLISIVLSILFAIIVSSLFVDSNKKKIATLWTLGYRKQEIIRVFLTTYIFPIIITITVALPISFSIIYIMKLLVMNFAHILIPFAVVWWMPILAVAIIGLIFSLSIVISILTMKGDTALAAFKEE